MSKWDPTDAEITEIYTMFWRFVEMVVHRYGSSPTGSLLTVLTISLLDQVDYHPTIGELAKIIRLPKSTVSRYVSTEMNSGYLEEVIDPEDRRRRRLHTTQKARLERKWVKDRLIDIAHASSQVIRNPSKNVDQGEALKRIMLGFGENI
jgi:DNA-binding MarR family transcriptional regulator